jgi:hypothetical protein
MSAYFRIMMSVLANVGMASQVSFFMKISINITSKLDS